LASPVISKSPGVRYPLSRRQIVNVGSPSAFPAAYSVHIRQVFLKERSVMYRQTTFAFVLALVACVASACGGSSSSPTTPTPAPILAAVLTTPSGATLNDLTNCEAARLAARVITGSSIAQCGFSAPMINTGAGCAANVRGTLTASRDEAGSQPTGTAGWSYGALVRPGEQFSYPLNTLLSVPSSGKVYWVSAPQWDNVRCP
jgi:hypothetical protein